MVILSIAITPLFLFLVSVTSINADSVISKKTFIAKPIDRLWVKERTSYMFQVNLSQSFPHCGQLATSEQTSCIYCVGETCGVPEKGDILSIHFTPDKTHCTNSYKILTKPKFNGLCPVWVNKQAMIIGKS